MPNNNREATSQRGAPDARVPSTLRGSTYEGYRVHVRLVREGSNRYHPIKITGPEQVYEFCGALGREDREVFCCLHLDARSRVIACEEVSRGTLSQSLVHPREVYKGALLSSAHSIVVVHNHPSGDPSPSPEDLAVNGRLWRAGDLLGVPLLDSIIIGHDTYHSSQEGGGLKP